MKKRIICIFLVLVLCFCICFQCSLNSYAIIGIDDALLIGAICLDLAACGVTIYSVSQFVQSDTFADFTHQLGADIDDQISLVKRRGELFFATTKMGWSMITRWVKNHFSGATEDKTIEFETELTTSPEFLILNDGVTVPYAEFMELPFFIYKSASSGKYVAYYCNNQNAGMVVNTHDVQIYCTGTGSVGLFILNGDSWSDQGLSAMTYGISFRGVTGSIKNIQFNNNVYVNNDSFYLYRTIDIVTSGVGDIDSSYVPTQSTPGETQTQTSSVRMHSDASKYPGAIDAPTETINDGEKVLVKVPEAMVVDAGNDDLTLTTNGEVIGQAIADTTVADVEPRILTDTAAEGVDTVVGDVIADTPAGELSGNAQSDIEIANKFRLPKSFLEGFPFSIPYSVFIGIKSFVAEGQAPVFTIPFSIERLGISENVTIDLTQWNPVARLCRALLSVVWVAGLAMACNKFLKR